MTAAEQIEAEYAPLIAAAAARDALRREEEELRRTVAFVDVPHVVCGVPLRAMTAIDYIALVDARNAHVTAADVPESGPEMVRFWRAHSLAFMWALCPDFRPNDARARSAFIERCSLFPLDQLADGITEYLSDTFADSPRAPSPAASAPVPADPVGVSFVAYWQHAIASAYGWSRAEIRAMPLKELFQALRLIRADASVRAGKVVRAPLDGEADRLWAEKLAKINALAA